MFPHNYQKVYLLIIVWGEKEMKNKILKATALFLAAICILGCVCGCGKKTVSTAAKGELTRLKWIEMLSDSFYIQNSKTEDPYFSDVSKENELFGKIQECVELGIIPAEKQFNANYSVSFKEAALNCINAIGKSTVSDYLQTDKELSEKELLKFAKEKILTEISDKKTLTQADAEKALKNSTELLLNKPLFEKEKIKLSEGVTDLRSSKAEYTDSSAVISDVKGIKKDSVIILPPSAEYPAGLARKVVSVSGNTVTLGEASIDEVFDEIKVSKRTELKSTDFTPAAGVTVGEYSAVENTSRTKEVSAAPTLLTAQSNSNSYTELASDGKASFDIVLNLTKGELSLDEKWGSLKGSYSDAKSLEEASDFKFDGRNLYTEKYKAGYEIKGKISLSDISLDNDVDYKKIAGIKVGVNRCETKVNFKASVNLSVKGKVDNDIDVLTAKIPIGASGLSVKCVFVLSIGLNGEVSVKSEIRNTTSYIYEKGLKQVNNTDVKNKATVTGELTAQVGPKAVLSILGMDFFDIQALIGMGAKAEISAEQGSTEIPCVDVKAYAPIVTLKFAGDKKTVLNALGFSAEWKAYDIEDGWKKSSVVSICHWESKKGWIDKCTHPTDDEESGNQAGNSGSSRNNTTSAGSKTETPKSNSDISNGSTSKWTYKNGGNDFIIKTNGSAEIKIPIDMSEYLKAGKNEKIVSYDVERNCFYEIDGHLFFWQKVSIHTEEIETVGDIHGGGREDVDEFIKYNLKNNSLIKIKDRNNGQYLKNALFVKDGKFYYELSRKGAAQTRRGDICYIELNKNTVDVFKNCKVLFDFEVISGAFNDLDDVIIINGMEYNWLGPLKCVDISGNKVYCNVSYEHYDEKTETVSEIEIKFSINTDGTGIKRIS